MLGWRFLAGIIGGVCVGIAFSVLARLNNPDRAFGLLLFVQFGIGSIVIFSLPWLENLLNDYAVFYVIGSFVFCSLVLLCWLPPLPISSKSHRKPIDASGRVSHALLILLALFVYQIAANGIWAYVSLIGKNANIVDESLNLLISVTGLLGLVGAMLPVINGKRLGRLFWLSSGIGLSVVGAMLLSLFQATTFQTVFFAISMALLFFSWPAVVAYLLAVIAEMDRSGRLSTIGGVVSSLGLATGPLMASSLWKDNDSSLMLYTSALFFLLSFFLLMKPLWLNEKI